jgi:hypothetical protein
VNKLPSHSSAQVPPTWPGPAAAPNMTPAKQMIVHLRPRARVVVRGTIRSPETVTVGSSPAYHFTLVDGSGELDVLFLGWSSLRGLRPSTRITAEGTLGSYDGMPALWNPRYAIERPAQPAATASAVASPLRTAPSM